MILRRGKLNSKDIEACGDSDSKQIESNESTKKLEYDPFKEGRLNVYLTEEIEKRHYRIENENFFIELLTQPIVLDKDKGINKITINRDQAKYSILSNKGKKVIRDEIIKEKQGDQIEKLKELDKEIVQFLCEKKDGNPKMTVDLEANELMMRWASGGSICIVNYDEKKWIPMFYRDINPAGWNIALGASERHFDSDMNLSAGYDPHQEHIHIDDITLREFGEEFLIVSGKDKKMTYFMLEPDGDDTKKEMNPQININKLAQDHLKLRKDIDKLEMTKSDETIKFKRVPTQTEIIVKSPNQEDKTIKNVLAAINIFDLGIEVTKVYTYSLTEDQFILDGEVLETRINEHESEKELVRMPVALISLEYLKSIVVDNSEAIHYDENLSSIVINTDKDGNEVSLMDDDIHLFKYDLNKRGEFIVKHGNNYKERRILNESERYKKSKKYFNLEKGSENVLPEYKNHFTPATVKLLMALFSQIEDKDL